METMQKLSYLDCKRFLNKSDVKIDKKFLNKKTNIIGQERGIDSIQFALKVKKSGYNLYVAGESGTGKTTFSTQSAKQIAKTEKTPDDYCYVYNFQDPTSPKAICLSAGEGKKFKEDMQELIEIVKQELEKTFTNDSYDKQKHNVLKDYNEQKDSFLNELSQKAEDLDFVLKTSHDGIYFMPIFKGETLNEELYDNLSEYERIEIEKKSDILKEKSSIIMKSIKKIELENENNLSNLNYKIGLLAVSHFFDELLEKHQNNLKVLDYLKDMKEDILENISDFIDIGLDDEDEILLPFIQKTKTDDFKEKYQVNLIIDNKEQIGAPVIVDYNPTYQSLLGELDYENEFGNLQTNHMKIKPGLLHKANGGYLILQANDILSIPNSWHALRLSLSTKEIIIDNLKNQSLNISINSLKPEAIPSDIKVILIGDPLYYYILKDNDDSFSKNFKILAEFDTVMNFAKENVKRLATYMSEFCVNEKLLKLSPDALVSLIEHASQMTENKEKLSTKFGLLSEIIYEANTWAEILGEKEQIDSNLIKKAISEKEYRFNMQKDNYQELYFDNTININTSGKKIAEINALAVYSNYDFDFATPQKLTATSYLGEEGVVNIEDAAKLSGKIHSKASMILESYLGQKYATDFPLSFTANICFEQSYSHIDGDSASCAELIVLLSSLSELEINQSFAITGSISQQGKVQAIGAVSKKIEGFYEICEAKGLNNKQAVLIPKQNIQSLSLNDKVIKAIKDESFHIYAVDNVDQAIELFFDKKADFVHKKVYNKLKSYHEKILDINKS